MLPRGAGAVYGVRFNHNFPRFGHYDSQVVLGVDRKEYRNDIDFAGQPLGNDVTVDPLSLSYIGQWALPAGTINFYLTGERNIPGGSIRLHTGLPTAPGHTASQSGAAVQSPAVILEHYRWNSERQWWREARGC